MKIYLREERNIRAAIEFVRFGGVTPDPVPTPMASYCMRAYGEEAWRKSKTKQP